MKRSIESDQVTVSVIKKKKNTKQRKIFYSWPFCSIIFCKDADEYNNYDISLYNTAKYFVDLTRKNA